jgi:hypothetical protein
MLLGLPVTVPNRKLRLFALACCHRIEARLTHHLSRQALVLAEKYTEGLATDEDMRELSHRFMDVYNIRLAGIGRDRNATDTADLDAAFDMMLKVFPANTALSAVRAARDQSEERLIQSQLLRCIFGNPFHPITLDTAWLNPPVKALARSLDSDRRFEELPILADALDEAGCQEPSVLDHLRSSGPHVRGCWPLDLILGRE